MVSNMSIKPISARPKPLAPAGNEMLRRAAVRFATHTRPLDGVGYRPYVGALAVSWVPGLGVAAAGSVIGTVKSVKTQREVKQLRQLPEQVKQQAPTGLLNARRVGWGIMTAALPLALVGTFGPGWAVLASLALVATSLATLITEKVVRAVQWRSAAAEIGAELRTTEDQRQLAEDLTALNVSDKARQLLTDRLAERRAA